MNITKEKQAHRYREQTGGSVGKVWGGEEQDRGRESRGTIYYVLNK